MTPVPERLLSALAAFGLHGAPVPLPGGQGNSWRVGDVVLKPDVDPEFQQWLGTEVAAIEQRDFRLPMVRRALNGDWVVEGWGAQSLLPGWVPQGPVRKVRRLTRMAR